MQLEVLIINGPGFQELIRSSTFLVSERVPSLNWSIVRRNDMRYVSIYSTDHNPHALLHEYDNPISVGKLIYSGLPERNAFKRFRLIIEFEHKDNRLYFYVGNYSFGQRRLGEGMIYDEDQFHKLFPGFREKSELRHIGSVENNPIVTQMRRRETI